MTIITFLVAYRTYILLVLGIISSVFGGYFLKDKYVEAKHQLGIQEASIRDLRLQLENSKLVIDGLGENIANISRVHTEYNKKVSGLNNQFDSFRKKIYREELGKSSLESVILKDERNRVEKLINDGISERLKCLELITSNVVLTDEQNHTCFPDNYR